VGEHHWGLLRACGNLLGTPKFKRIPSSPLPSTLQGKKTGPLECMLNSPIGCMNMAIPGLVPMGFWVFILNYQYQVGLGIGTT